MKVKTGGAINQEQSALMQSKIKLVKQFKRGANWFYWIAGLSLLNSVILMVGGGLNFLIGLGATQLIDAIAIELGNARGPDQALVLRVVAWVLGVGIAGVFAFFGVLANDGSKGAFIIGMVLYALDGLLFVWVEDWLSVGLHLLVLWGLYRGLSALDRLM